VLLELNLPRGMGFIVRTVAQGKSKNELSRDARFLIKLWSRIEKIIKRGKAPRLVYEEYDLTLRVIRDSFSEDVSRLIVDSKEEFYRIKHFIHTFSSELARRLEFYRGEDLFLDRDIEKQVNRIFESRVYLKSKAYLVIEPTEGLVVIDVNSGGFKKNLSQEDAAFKVNCDAAVEVAHQLRLRDLGGIVVVDFIDMERESHRREVFNILKRELNKDKAKYDIAGISKFGLVELTRERIHKTVQTLSHQICPYCQGKGRVKTPLTVSIFALKELKKYLKDNLVKQLNLYLNPLVADEILKNKQALGIIERKFHTKINLIPNPALHLEDIKFS
jgi:ribonuclease G